MELIHQVIVTFIPFLFALSFHEFAHGWVAKKKGDKTAEIMGRLTLNPLVHMDLVGTVIMPLMGLLSGWALFGWAKPVPVNERNLKNPVKDMFWIALAGPLSNLLLAVIGIFAFTFIANVADFTAKASALSIMRNFVLINVLLAVFNMLPMHPLDGGKVLARFLPTHWNRFLEDNQQKTSIVLIGFFILGGFRYLTYPVVWVMGVLEAFVAGILSFIF